MISKCESMTRFCLPLIAPRNPERAKPKCTSVIPSSVQMIQISNAMMMAITIQAPIGGPHGIGNPPWLRSSSRTRLMPSAYLHARLMRASSNLRAHMGVEGAHEGTRIVK